MTLVAFVSARSPGLTTTVHALAARWPTPRRAVVAELNPEGGSLGARHELAPEPGLTTLAAAGRRGLTAATVMAHCRPIPGGPVALLGPIAPDQMASALSVLGSRLAVALDSLPGADVLADCGRLDVESPALPVIHASRYVVLVVTPTLEGVAYAQSRLDALEALGLPDGHVGLVTVGSRPYPLDQIGAALQLPTVGSIAADPAGARRLGIGRATGRSKLLRSAAGLASSLVRYLPPEERGIEASVTELSIGAQGAAPWQ
ncbi:MAG: hypothetical protein M3N98_07530 [Actinomycetota bacterium]|nr:hypothetical protein [Actinomycetota bacterium]